MKKLFMLLTVLLITGSLFAQNYLFDKGESGFNIESKMKNVSHVRSLEISPGYTLNGRTSINFHYRFPIINIDPLEFDRLISYNVFGIDLSYLLIKNYRGRLPINLSLNASYFLGIGRYDLEDGIINCKTQIYDFGMDLIYLMNANPNCVFIPSIGMKFRHSESEIPPHIKLGQAPIYDWIIYPIQTMFTFHKFYVFAKLEFGTNPAWEDLLYPTFFTADIGIGFLLPKK
jgi:hypothetical protein